MPANDIQCIVVWLLKIGICSESVGSAKGQQAVKFFPSQQFQSRPVFFPASQPQVRQTYSEVLATEKRTQLKARQAQEAVDNWGARAMLALEKGDEELARCASVSIALPPCPT